MIIPTAFVFHGIQRNTQKHLKDILSWTWYTQHNIKWRTNMQNMHYTNKTNKTHKVNSKKNHQNHIQTSYFQISTETRNPRNLGLETWNTLEIIKNPYLFLKIDEENGGFVSENRGFGRGRGGQGNEDARDARKNWKVFENCLGFNPICTKHAFSVTRMSHEQVTKMSRQNPLTQILKIFLSVFRDLEVHSRASRKGTHESF